MIKYLVNRPIAVCLSFFALIVLAIVAFWNLPISLLPDVDVPRITIKIYANNYSSTDIEKNAIAPIRVGLLQLSDLNRIESTSSEGSGVIQLVFDHGVNKTMNFIEVNEKIDLIMNNLPREIKRPIILQSGISDIPIFKLSISQRESVRKEKWADVSLFSRDIIRRRIEQIPEVAMVDITGTVHPQIQLIPKYGYLESLNISNGLLMQVFNENGVDLGDIQVEDGNYRYNLKFSRNLSNIASIENLPVKVNERLFKLSEIVDVVYTTESSNGTFMSNGKQAVNFSIIKQSGAQLEGLKSNFESLLDHMKKDYPGLNFEISQDQRELLNYSISNLKQDLFLGGTLAFILMLIFIRKVRSALLIGITIPISLIITQLGFYFCEISINIVSLGGLILGLGMIIDNSIVVIDSINRHRSLGQDLTESVINGVNEVVRPIIASVFTNSAIFIPLLFMNGLVSAVFYDQAISIIIGIVSSLIVSIVLLPPLYRLIWLIKIRTNSSLEIQSRVNITRWYEFLFSKVFKYPLFAILLVFLLVVSSFFLFEHISKDRLPPITRTEVELFIDWNEDISIDENTNRANRLLNVIKNEVLASNVWIGQQQYLMLQQQELSYNQCKLYLKAVDVGQLKVIRRSLMAFCNKNYSQAELHFSSAENAFDAIYANDLPPIRLSLQSDNGEAMPNILDVESYIFKLKNIIPNIELNSVRKSSSIKLDINVREASIHQISTADITQKVEATFKPTLIDNFQGGNNLVPIVIANRPFTSLNEMLQNTFIKNNQNVEIPLSNLVRTSQTYDHRNISANANGMYYAVDINSDDPEGDLKKIKDFNKLTTNQFKIEYSGSYFDNQVLIKEMSYILLISVLLLYFILAAQFESLIQPLFILIELPIALSGAFIFLYIGGNTLNIMSMIGIIVMSGIIINDSILKIDAINQLRKDGLPLMESIIRGGHARLKSIIMISVTSIGSLAPTIFMNDLGSELQKPLALTLIGGMFIGMFVSLFFVPLLYWFAYRKHAFQNDHKL